MNKEVEVTSVIMLMLWLVVICALIISLLLGL